MDILTLGILFVGGLLGGLYGSTVGGGGLVTFPLLILLGVPTHIALGTQRFSAVILELASVLKFHHAKKLSIKPALILGVIAAVGSSIGTNIVIHLEENVLNILVGIMLLIATIILLNKDKFGIKQNQIRHKHLILIALSTLLLGIYGGFFGAGFGAFMAIALVVFGFTFIESAAMSRLIGLCMSLVGAIIFAHNGLINYAYGLSLGAGFAIGSWIGISIALKKNDTYIKSLLIIIILFTLLKLVLNSLGINFV